MFNYLIVCWDKFPSPRIEVDEIFIRELAGRMSHRIDWILQAEEKWDQESESFWAGGRTWIAPTISGDSRLQLLAKHLLSICNDLKVFSRVSENNYDFVLIKDKFISALFAILATRRKKTRLVYWLSYPFPEAWLYQAREKITKFIWFNRLRGFLVSFLLYRIILPQVDHAFVQSEAMREDISSRGIPREKLTPVPMGVGLDRMPFPYPLKKAHKAPGERWIVHLGTLIRVRNPSLLIRVLARVRQEVPGAVLYFVGSGEVDADEKVLREEAKRLGLEEVVRITGWMERDHAWEYVAAADVCVSPYVSTPILDSTSPTKLVEYMALGRPVVASEHPEQRQVIRESGAGSCVPLDEESFSRAIVELLGDPETAEMKGRQGRSWVEANRSYAVIARNVERELARIVAGDPVKRKNEKTPGANSK